MKCSRWIAVCVDTFDHEMFSGEPFSRRDAWLWLIANAAWKDRRVNHKGKMIEMKRGQVLAGRSFLAETWGWSEKQVRNFLGQCMAESMIEKGQSNGHWANVVTICNYDAYQNSSESEGQSKGQSGASAPPEKGQTLTKNTITERENPQAREGETEVHAGVFVNCETIRHRDFTISIPAIEMQLLGTVGRDEIKAVATGHAVQWATDIAAGKRKPYPDNPASFIRQSIQNQRLKARTQPAGRQMQSDPSRMVIDKQTPLNVRPREAF